MRRNEKRALMRKRMRRHRKGPSSQTRLYGVTNELCCGNERARYLTIRTGKCRHQPKRVRDVCRYIDGTALAERYLDDLADMIGGDMAELIYAVEGEL